MSLGAASSTLATSPPYRGSNGIYYSRDPTPNYPREGVWQHVMGNKSLDDQTLAVKESNQRGRSITLGELKTDAIRLGIAIKNLPGIKPGDTVMLSAPNSIHWMLALYACLFAGVRLALANPIYEKSEMIHTTLLTKPKYVFAHSTVLIKFIRIGFPLNHIILLNEDVGGFAGALAMKRLLASVPIDDARIRTEKPYEPKDLNEAVFYPFSSGTTGLPKAVEIPHRSVVAMLCILNGIRELVNDKPFRSVAFLPFFHAFGLLTAVLLSPLNAGTMFLCSPSSLPKWIEIIEREKIEVGFAVPPVIVGLGVAPNVRSESFRSLRWLGVGAAPLDAATTIRVQEKMGGVEIRQGMGMSECTVGAVGLSVGSKPGTVGYLMPGVEARLVDDELNDVPRGERGELLLRGQNIMNGYFANENATKETFHEPGHWLRTGDVAICDEDGVWSIVDRIKELIKYSGFQVAPAELEGLLRKHPRVKAAGVIGIYDAKRGTELPRAYIELIPTESKLSDQESEKLIKEIDEFVRKNTSVHKYLRGGIRIVDVVPASVTGKILRKDLRLLRKKEEAEMAGEPRASL